VAGTEAEGPFKELRDAAARITSVERQGTQREKHGVFTGRYVINPVNGLSVPIWVSDYVLMDYGTGAVMGVPSGDQRDFDFARKYGLDIVPVVLQADDPLYERLRDVHGREITQVDWDQAMSAEGYLVQSGQFTGMRGGKHSEAVEAITSWLEQRGIGRKKVQFRLRDWLISRQRFWGNPIPMIHCDVCGDVPVPEEDLPVMLPEDLDLGAGETLAEYAPFYETTCPKCGRPAKRITDTMDTFTCSSWYYLRYCDPHNDQAPFSKESVARWMPVDNYVGGIEHAILHLLYSRFWTRVARDMGMCDFSEPFTNLLCQGMVKDEHGETMSKSKGNVVPPSSVIEPYGADTMRLAILFVAPPEKDFDWDPNAVSGCNRFLKRAWETVWQLAEGTTDADVLDPSALDERAAALNRDLNRLGLKCSADYDRQQFNTAISAVMELTNSARSYLAEVEPAARDRALCRLVARDVVAMLAPICPHWAEELYHEALGQEGFVYDEPWPEFDPDQAVADTIEIAVQVMGKVRAHVDVPADASEDELRQVALDAVAAQIEGKTVRKVVVVPGRLVNIVAS
jgi:leucyl-tRNA synthetase